MTDLCLQQSSRGRLGIFRPSSSQEQPLNSSKDSSEKQPSDSAEKPPSDSVENQQPNITENRQPNLPQNQQPKLPENQQSNLPENRPSDSSMNQPLGSSENPPQKLDSSKNRPLDPLRELNPLRKLDPLERLGSLKDRHLSEKGGFPRWLKPHSRRLLAGRRNRINANVVVAKDGSGKCKTIAQALAMVPMKNTKKFVIHIKQGVYKEKVEVTKKMLHVMFVGDGPTKTIITGDVAFLPDRVGTYLTATVGKFIYITFYIFCYHFTLHKVFMIQIF